MDTSIEALMRRRYCSPEWAIFFEVANGTGIMQKHRYADAVAMNLYPSRGLEIHGFEVKYSRSDWQRELANPAKAEEGVYEYCDRWWVVAIKGIVKDNELPATWGLIECNGGILRQTVAAPLLKPSMPTRLFMAALLRRAGQVDEKTIAHAVSAAEKNVTDSHDGRVARQVKDETAQFQKTAERLAEFEKLTGIKIDHYAPVENFAAAFMALQNAGIFNTYRGIARLNRDVAEFQKRLALALEEFKLPAAEACSDG